MSSEVPSDAGGRDAQAARHLPKPKRIDLDFRISLEQLRRKFNEPSHHLRMMDFSRDDAWIAGEDWLERINSRIDAFAAILRAEKPRLRIRTNLIGKDYSFSRIFDAPSAAPGETRYHETYKLKVGEFDAFIDAMDFPNNDLLFSIRRATPEEERISAELQQLGEIDGSPHDTIGVWDGLVCTAHHGLERRVLTFSILVL